MLELERVVPGMHLHKCLLRNQMLGNIVCNKLWAGKTRNRTAVYVCERSRERVCVGARLHLRVACVGEWAQVLLDVCVCVCACVCVRARARVCVCF